VERPESVVESVARIWPELFPGAEILDRDLAVGRERLVPFVAVDAAGRLVFAVAVESADEAAASLVLDASVFIQRCASVLARHFDSPRLRPELPGTVWLIAQRFQPEAIARLRAMDTRRLRVFELVQLESRRGSRTHVSEVQLELDSTPPDPSAGEREVFDDLPAEGRALGDVILQRLARVDDELESNRRGAALEWRFHDEFVCGVSVGEGTFEGHVSDGVDPTPIVSREGLEHFLERAVSRYLTLLRQRRVESPRASSALREPILTPEEMAAFDSDTGRERSDPMPQPRGGAKLV